MNIDEITDRAKKSNSFFSTVTIKDNSKDENNLEHYTFIQNFSDSDIVSSLDECVRSIKKIEKESRTPIISLKRDSYPPLKIAIITHFSDCPSSFSPGTATRALIKVLKKNGHEPVWFVQETSGLDGEEVGCEIRKVIPTFNRSKGIINYEAKERLIDILKKNITPDFDVAISIDLYIDDCITYREAIKESDIPIPCLHWARSGVKKKIDFNMPNSRYIYMNKHDSLEFSKNIGVEFDKVRVINNIKDPLDFWQCDDITRFIVDEHRLWEKDIIQTFPVATERNVAKGLSDVIAVFGSLKSCGKDVSLIICNSNWKGQEDEINNIKRTAKYYGLEDGDIIITSTLEYSGRCLSDEIPNKVISELMRLSNLFIFPSRADVAPQSLLEASLSKNLIVINEDLELLNEFCGTGAVLSYPFTSNNNLHYKGRDVKSFDILAKNIIKEIDLNKEDKQFRHVWRNHNSDVVYRDLMSIIYEII